MPSYFIYRSFKRLLPTLGGRVLDVGCGEKPYERWFGRVSEYVGLDVEATPAVDVVVAPDGVWPLRDGAFDVVLASQILEFCVDPDLTLREIDRVLKRGGTAVLSFPFIYHEHRAPFDRYRFTVYRAAEMFPGYDCRITRQGGFGSVMAILTLNWIEVSLNRTRTTRVLKAILLPLYIPLSFAINVAALLMDIVDRTGAFYSNAELVARKP